MRKKKQKVDYSTNIIDTGNNFYDSDYVGEVCDVNFNHRNISWILDSGAIFYMSPHKN